MQPKDVTELIMYWIFPSSAGNETTELDGAGIAGNETVGEDVDATAGNETVAGQGAQGGDASVGNETVEGVGGGKGAVEGEASGDSSSALPNGRTFYLPHPTHSWISFSNTQL